MIQEQDFLSIQTEFVWHDHYPAPDKIRNRLKRCPVDVSEIPVSIVSEINYIPITVSSNSTAFTAIKKVSTFSPSQKRLISSPRFDSLSLLPTSGYSPNLSKWAVEFSEIVTSPGLFISTFASPSSRYSLLQSL
jgi:hypothetical protein